MKIWILLLCAVVFSSQNIMTKKHEGVHTCVLYRLNSIRCKEIKFSERLPLQIETLLSGFFSKEIYRFFDASDTKYKDTSADNYQDTNAKLESKLQEFFAEMETSISLKVQVHTMKISSCDETIQGDWGIFNVDVEHKGKKYFQTVVAFKGTNFWKKKDVVADANQNMVFDNLLQTLVPEGFYNALNPVKSDDFFVEEEISVLIAREGGIQRNIIITGHSLGGTLAKLIGTRIKSPGFLNQIKTEGCENLAKAIKEAQVYTFGAPQIFQKDFSSNLSKDSSYTSNFHHFIREYDPVPQLQLSIYRNTYGRLFRLFSNYEEADFSDFGNITLLGENRNQVTFSGKITVDKLREISRKWSMIGELCNIADHGMKIYMKHLKIHSNIQQDHSEIAN